MQEARVYSRDGPIRGRREWAGSSLSILFGGRIEKCPVEEWLNKGLMAVWSLKSSPPQGRKLPPQGWKSPPQGRKLPSQGRKLPSQGRKSPPQGRKLLPRAVVLSTEDAASGPQHETSHLRRAHHLGNI
eukprot:637110-Prorocentrum_minimum.AAC.1